MTTITFDNTEYPAWECTQHHLRIYPATKKDIDLHHELHHRDNGPVGYCYTCKNVRALKYFDTDMIVAMQDGERTIKTARCKTCQKHLAKQFATKNRRGKIHRGIRV